MKGRCHIEGDDGNQHSVTVHDKPLCLRHQFGFNPSTPNCQDALGRCEATRVATLVVARHAKNHI
jgi:hypothetical protein